MKKFIMLIIILFVSIWNMFNTLASNKIETTIQFQESREIAWLSSMLMSRNYIDKVKSEDEIKIEENIVIDYDDKNAQCSKKYPWTIYRKLDDKCVCPDNNKQWNSISKLCATEKEIKLALNKQQLDVKKEEELAQNNTCNTKKPWTIYKKSANKCVCTNYYYEEWSDVNNRCENIFNYIPNIKEKRTLNKYINIIDNLYLKSPDKIEKINSKIENILFDLENGTQVYFVFSVLQNQIKLLTAESWKINDWSDIDLNCDIADIKIWYQIWAGCNSTIWEWEEYNSEHCFDYKGNQVSGCNMLSNMKESDYDSKNWVNNIWGKFYTTDTMFSACTNWYHIPTKDEWNILRLNLKENRSWWSWDWWKWHFSKNKNNNNNMVNALVMPLSWYDNWNRGKWSVIFSNTANVSWHYSPIMIKSNSDTVGGGWDISRQKASVRCIKDYETWWKCSVKHWTWKVWNSWECEITSCDSWYSREFNYTWNKAVSDLLWISKEDDTCKKITPKVCSSRVNSVLIWEWMSDINNNCIMNKCYDSYKLQNWKCVYSYLKACQKSFWNFAINTTNNLCKCKSWYQWSSDRKSCVVSSTSTSTNTNTSTNTSTNTNTSIDTTYLEKYYNDSIEIAKRKISNEKKVYNDKLQEAGRQSRIAAATSWYRYPQSYIQQKIADAYFKYKPKFKTEIYNAEIELKRLIIEKDLKILEKIYSNNKWLEYRNKKINILNIWYNDLINYSRTIYSEILKDYSYIKDYANIKARTNMWILDSRIYNSYVDPYKNTIRSAENLSANLELEKKGKVLDVEEEYIKNIR